MGSLRRSERGNVFFLIMIGVVLFAAVSAAVVSTSRGGKSITDEKARLMAGEILRYGAQLKSATNHLYENGVSESDIRFSHPKLATADYGDIAVNPTYQVFAEQGGGLPYSEPKADALTQSGVQWDFEGGTKITDVGGADSELTALLRNVKQKVCGQIDALLGYSTIPVINMGTSDCPHPGGGNSAFLGDFNVDYVTIVPVTPAPAQACVACGSEYYYYNVLIER